MDFTFSEIQEAAPQAGARVARASAGRSSARSKADGYDPSTWRELAELGWPGVSVPEEQGGAGLAFLEEAVLFEELGRALYPGPYFATVALALPALPARKTQAAVAGGQTTLVGRRRRARARSRPVDKVLTGDGAVAAPVARSCRRWTRRDRSDGSKARIRRASTGRACSPRCARGGRRRPAGAGARDRAREARQQFGKKIGVYQAVSHQLVDAFVDVRAGALARLLGGVGVAEGDAQAPVAAAAAKANATTPPWPRASARSRCTAASASPGSTCCTATTSARSGSSRSPATRRCTVRRSRRPCSRARPSRSACAPAVAPAHAMSRLLGTDGADRVPSMGDAQLRRRARRQLRFRKVRARSGSTAFGVERGRLPARRGGVPPLPRRAGRALLRPQRHGALRGRGRRVRELGPGGARPRRLDHPAQVLERRRRRLVLL